MKLNVGCGLDIRKGYVNHDIVAAKGVTVHDCSIVPYPIPCNYFDEILSMNSLEHLSSNISPIMREWHRILKPNGRVIIRVPHYTNGATYYTQHKRGYSIRTWEAYMKFEESNRMFDFGFKRIEYAKIHFIKGVHVYNHLLEFVINHFARKNPKYISIIYESTFLSAIPAKYLEVCLVK